MDEIMLAEEEESRFDGVSPLEDESHLFEIEDTETEDEEMLFMESDGGDDAVTAIFEEDEKGGESQSPSHHSSSKQATSSNRVQGAEKKNRIEEFKERLLRCQNSPSPEEIAALEEEAQLLWAARPSIRSRKENKTITVFCLCCKTLTATAAASSTLPFGLSLGEEGKYCKYCYVSTFKQYQYDGILRCHRRVMDFIVNISDKKKVCEDKEASKRSTKVTSKESIKRADGISAGMGSGIRGFAEKLLHWQRDGPPTKEILAELEKEAQSLFEPPMKDEDVQIRGPCFEIYCECCRKLTLTPATAPQGHTPPFGIQVKGFAKGAKMCPSCYERGARQYSAEGMFRCHRKVMEYVVNEAMLSSEMKMETVERRKNKGESHVEVEENLPRKKRRELSVEKSAENLGNTSGARSEVSRPSRSSRSTEQRVTEQRVTEQRAAGRSTSRSDQIRDFALKLLRRQRGDPGQHGDIFQLENEARLIWSESEESKRPRLTQGVEMKCVCCRTKTLTSVSKPKGHAAPPFSIQFPESEDGRICTSCFYAGSAQFSTDGIFRCHRNTVMQYVINEELLWPEGLQLKPTKASPLDRRESSVARRSPQIFDSSLEGPRDVKKERRSTANAPDRKKDRIRKFAFKLLEYQQGGKVDSYAFLLSEANSLWKDAVDEYAPKYGSAMEMYCPCCQTVTSTALAFPKGLRSPEFDTVFPKLKGSPLCSLCYKRIKKQWNEDGVFRCHRNDCTKFIVNEAIHRKPDENPNPRKKKKVKIIEDDPMDDSEPEDHPTGSRPEPKTNPWKGDLKFERRDFLQRLLQCQRSHTPRNSQIVHELQQEAETLWPQSEFTPRKGKGTPIFCMCCDKETLTAESKPGGSASLPFSITIQFTRPGKICSFCYSKAYNEYQRDGVFRCHRSSVLDYVINESLFE